MEKIKIGISSCLLGKPVRYDGGHRHDGYITDILGQYAEWFPVCPEAECGLGVPREAMRLVGTSEKQRLVTINSGLDRTEVLLAWIDKRLPELESENLSGFIFKSKSPSSGLTNVIVYTPSGVPTAEASGLFARAFVTHFPDIPVIDDSQFHDSCTREDFIKRVFSLCESPLRGC